VRQRTGPWELYDLDADRTESHDLAPAEPDLVRRLESSYRAWMRRADVLEWDEARPQSRNTSRRTGAD
jgi:arylsulfatase